MTNGPLRPLVGRAAEVDALSALHRRASGGEPCAALLWGEAGVGKMRLLNELVANARGTGARVGAGAGFPYACPPFAPLREAFGALELPDVFEIDEPPALSPAAAERAKYRRFVSATRTLRDGSATAPLVVTIDDLQWADIATVEFLTYLVGHAFRAAQATMRVLVVAAVRSDDIEHDHLRSELLGKLRKDGIAMLAVNPLSDNEMRRLVTDLWPTGSSRAQDLDRVCALAEGKPYFAEELVSSAASGLPLSIRAGVLARLAQLPPEHRDVLRHAAVIGVRFDATLLAELVGRPIGEIWSVLEGARDAQLVRDTPGQGAEFAFRHAITREIVYGELLPPHARTIHARIASRLTQHGDADAEQLAYHWTAAGNAERATIANELAGDAAARRNAYRDAAIAYRQAIVLRRSDEDGGSYAALCDRLARIQLINGDLDEACTWGQRALDLYVDSGDRVKAGLLGIWLSRRFTDAGRPIERAIAMVESAMRFANPNDAGFRYSALTALAYFSLQQGRIETAAQQLALGDSIRGGHSPEDRHLFHDVRAEVRAHNRQLAGAVEDSLAAIEFARQIGEPQRLSITLCNYGRFAFFAGQNEKAISAYREAVEISEREHLGRAGALAKRALAFTYLLTGELESAQRTLDESRSVSGGIVADTAIVSIGLRVAFLRGYDDAAARYAPDDSIERAFASAQTQSIGPLVGSVAAYWDGIGKRSEARALRSRALPLIRSAALALWLIDQLATSPNPDEVVQARSLLAHAAGDPDHVVAQAHLALFDARVVRAGRDVKAAQALASHAAGRFGSIGWPWEHAQALELVGDWAASLEIYRRHGYLRDERRITEARRRTRHRTRSTALTPREVDVVRLAVAGLSNRAIADELFISERTVETHIASVFDRFDLTARSQLSSLPI